MESGIVSSTALNVSHDVSINDVKIGASTTNSAGSKAIAINSKSAEHGVTAVARTELTVAVNFTATHFAPAATDIALNGTVIDFSAEHTLALVVAKFNDTQVGDVVAKANADGTLTLSSDSGVNIKLKDIGSGTQTNAMFSTATDIHGESISASDASGTGAADTFLAFGNLTLSSADGSPIKISGTTADIAHLGLKQQSQELKVTGSGVSVDSLTNAQNALAKIDEALETVSLYRSSFGAIENRIDASLSNLTTLKVNTQSSLSRIIDANFAEV